MYCGLYLCSVFDRWLSFVYLIMFHIFISFIHILDLNIINKTRITLMTLTRFLYHYSSSTTPILQARPFTVNCANNPSPATRPSRCITTLSTPINLPPLIQMPIASDVRCVISGIRVNRVWRPIYSVLQEPSNYLFDSFEKIHKNLQSITKRYRFLLREMACYLTTYCSFVNVALIILCAIT